MKTKLLYTAWLCALGLASVGQSESYSTLEYRFNRSAPDASDTAAFINQGMQKAQSLFELGPLYTTNSGNLSNQVYIASGTDQLFYSEEGDSLNTEELLARTSEAESTDGAPIRFEISESDTYLCTLTTVNCSPQFVFHLILVRVTKTFGKREEEVWDVFLKEG